MKQYALLVCMIMSNLCAMEEDEGLSNFARKVTTKQLESSGHYAARVEGVTDISKIDCLNQAIQDTVPALITKLAITSADLKTADAMVVLRYLPQLTYLDLSNNRLNHLPMYCHANLIDLNLSHNTLSEKINITLFLGAFKALENLDLSHNQLTHLTEKMLVFEKKHPLKKLFLVDNRLKSFNLTPFMKHTSIAYVDLACNKFLYKVEFKRSIIKDDLNVALIPEINLQDCPEIEQDIVREYASQSRLAGIVKSWLPLLFFVTSGGLVSASITALGCTVGPVVSCSAFATNATLGTYGAGGFLLLTALCLRRCQKIGEKTVYFQPLFSEKDTSLIVDIV